jgi:hypothetical protein
MVPVTHDEMDMTNTECTCQFTTCQSCLSHVVRSLSPREYVPAEDTQNRE